METGRRRLVKGRDPAMKRTLASTFALCLLAVGAHAAPPASYDLILRGGTVYDGSGGQPFTGDVAVNGDRIAAIGALGKARGKTEIDARGLAVSPGFVNMLSWATETLLVDGRAQSDIRQGVTLEVMGEGDSMGPLNAAMKREAVEQQGDLKYPITWTTLGEYLDQLAARGIAPNVASFVGATTLRVHEVGYANRPPTPEELARMRKLADQAMEEGALGIGSSLIYAPAFYAGTDELVALCEEAAKYGGLYISHLRSEGNRLLEAIDELLDISRRARLPAEIYHFKAAGRENWGKLDAAVRKIEDARAAGLKITADMYTYTAGATGLDAAMPPWVQEGGLEAWIGRLKDPAVRAKVAKEMATPTDAWENLFLAAGPDQVLLVAFKNDRLKPLTGKTLAEVARMRGKSPAETAMDLVIEDDSRVGTVYFLMSEENVRKEIALPWVSFGSDAEAPAAEGIFLKANPHPRTYGNVARLLGRYVRDEKVIPLAEAVHRLTSLPAANLKLRDRGLLKAGYFADLVVFDPAKIADHATYDKPHQYATGVRQVFVNGVQVLKDGEPTGAAAGRVVRGPGWTGWKNGADSRQVRRAGEVPQHEKLVGQRSVAGGIRGDPVHGKTVAGHDHLPGATLLREVEDRVLPPGPFFDRVVAEEDRPSLPEKEIAARPLEVPLLRSLADVHSLEAQPLLPERSEKTGFARRPVAFAVDLIDLLLGAAPRQDVPWRIPLENHGVAAVPGQAPCVEHLRLIAGLLRRFEGRPEELARAVQPPYGAFGADRLGIDRIAGEDQTGEAAGAFHLALELHGAHLTLGRKVIQIQARLRHHPDGIVERIDGDRPDIPAAGQKVHLSFHALTATAELEHPAAVEEDPDGATGQGDVDGLLATRHADLVEADGPGPLVTEEVDRALLGSLRSQGFGSLGRRWRRGTRRHRDRQADREQRPSQAA
jgi:N-acyl-D-amino-acid deacylase